MVRSHVVPKTAILVLGGLLVAGPLGAAPADGAATVQGPGCPYPAAVSTVTDLRLAHVIVRAGEPDRAYVRVSSGAGRPRGTVTFRVAGRAFTVRLVGGLAAQWLPSHLAPGHTYRVTAHYNGHGCYRSSSDAAYLTVVGRHHGARH